MTQPYAVFGVANTVEPLPSPGTNTLLQDADPAIFYALDFFTWLINNLPGPRLVAAAAAASAPITKAIATAIPFMPSPQQLTQQIQFPMLAIYRTGSTFRWKRIGWNTDDCQVEVVYALPPLTAGQSEALVPILRAVSATLRYKAVASYDPNYTPPGGQAGQSPWGAAFAGMEAVYFDRDIHGNLQGAGNLWYPSVRMLGRFEERDKYVSDGVKFTGADITVNLTAPDGTQVAPFEQVATNPAPTVTSLSPTSGTHNGGTAVTITGTGFLSGPPVVLFGTTPATNIAFVSATSITCNTPAVSGAGALGVTVVNRDGQSGSLANAFTFT